MPSQTVYIRKEFWDRVKKSPSKIINKALKLLFKEKIEKEVKNE